MKNKTISKRINTSKIYLINENHFIFALDLTEEKFKEVFGFHESEKEEVSMIYGITFEDSSVDRKIPTKYLLSEDKCKESEVGIKKYGK